jgi:anti-sigma-K factor RskA
MPGSLRYQNPELQDLLASGYVTGTLRGPARKRMETLMRNDIKLSRRVRQWEDKLQPLHQYTPDIAPKPSTWKNIANAINGAADPLLESLKKKLNFYKFFSGFALACTLVMAILLGTPLLQKPAAAISYVAVMQDDNAQPTMVVTLTQENRILALDMLQKPQLAPDQSLQLWAISRVDGSITSLGSLTMEKHIEKSLTKPQWGLIKDAEYLIVSVESAVGATRPSERIISKGLCVKVEGWKSETG